MTTTYDIVRSLRRAPRRSALTGWAVVEDVGPALGLGCGLALSPDGSQAALTYSASTRALAAVRRAASRGVPAVAICSTDGSCGTPILALEASLGGARALGNAPDVLWDGDTIFVVGSGLQRDPDLARFEEHTVYQLGFDIAARRFTRFEIVAAQNPVLVLDGGVVTGARAISGAMEPRLFGPLGGAHAVVYASYLTRASDQDSSAGNGVLRLSYRVYENSGAVSAPANLVTVASGLRAPPQRLVQFTDGPRPRLSASATNLRDPEVLPGWDIVPSLSGLVMHLVYVRRDASGYFDVAARSAGPTPASAASSVWYENFRFSAGRLNRLPLRRHRVDTETGYERSSTHVVSLALSDDSPFGGEPSVVHDVVQDVPRSIRELRLADTRVGHWIDTVREPRVPAETCWEDRDVDPHWSEAELMLTPAVITDRWASRRAPSLSLVPRASPANGVRNTRDALSCLLARTLELGTTTEEANIARATYYPLVTDPVVSRLLSLGTSLMGQSAATISSRLVPGGTRLTGTLAVRANGAVFTATFVGARADTVQTLFSPSRTATPSIAWYRASSTDGSPVRLTIAAPPLRNDEPGIATLEVLNTPLARQLGFPISTPFLPRISRGAWIDISHGDEGDRFGPCEAREPCVLPSTPGGTDGTCGRVSDCLEPDQPLLALAVRGLSLELGRPPLAEARGMCLPNPEVGSNTPDDHCDDPATFFPGRTEGTYNSYPSSLAPSCSPAGTDRALLARRGECVTCGLLVEGESMPPGEVRRCDSHADCSFNRTCDDRGCTWQETDAYCTHRGSTFMGLPPGTGFCAVPDTSCGVARSIMIEPPGLVASTSTGAVLSPDRFLACPSLDLGPTTAGGDFEPRRLECVASGCVRPLGDDGSRLLTDTRRTAVNTYCWEDSACPPGHSCVASGVVAPPESFVPSWATLASTISRGRRAPPGSPMPSGPSTPFSGETARTWLATSHRR